MGLYLEQMQNIISLFLTRKNMKLLGRNEKKKRYLKIKMVKMCLIQK